MSMSGDIQLLRETVQALKGRVASLEQQVEDLQDSAAVRNATGDTVSREEAEAGIKSKSRSKSTTKSSTPVFDTDAGDVQENQ